MKRLVRKAEPVEDTFRGFAMEGYTGDIYTVEFKVTYKEDDGHSHDHLRIFNVIKGREMEAIEFVNEDEDPTMSDTYEITKVIKQDKFELDPMMENACSEYGCWNK